MTCQKPWYKPFYKYELIQLALILWLSFLFAFNWHFCVILVGPWQWVLAGPGILPFTFLMGLCTSQGPQAQRTTEHRHFKHICWRLKHKYRFIEKQWEEQKCGWRNGRRGLWAQFQEGCGKQGRWSSAETQAAAGSTDHHSSHSHFPPVAIFLSSPSFSPLPPP